MLKLSIELSDEELKVLRSDVGDIQDFLDNFIHNHCRRLIDKFVTLSGKGSRYTPENEKLEIIKSMKIETVEEKNKKINDKLDAVHG